MSRLSFLGGEGGEIFGGEGGEGGEVEVGRQLSAASVARALITSSEGVIGAWAYEGLRPEHHKAGPENLTLWAGWVRRNILLSELLSGIAYDRTSAGESICLDYVTRHKNEGGALIHLIRPSEDVFADQLEYVRNYAALRLERSAEITVQVQNILPFFAAVTLLHANRMRHTVELLEVLLNATIIVEQRVKHALACRRPIEYSPQIQPMIETPGHGSLPSGHATEAFVLALVLYALRCEAVCISDEKTGSTDREPKHDPWYEQLMRHAERIAINRTVAGVHFPVDSAAGMVLAQALADFYILKCSSGGEAPTRKFDGTIFKGDFAYENVLRSSPPPDRPKRGRSSFKVRKSELLGQIWKAAVEEWRVAFRHGPATEA